MQFLLETTKMAIMRRYKKSIEECEKHCYDKENKKWILDWN